MIIVRLVLLAALLLPLVGAAPAQTQNAPASMTLSTRPRTVEAGATVEAVVMLRSVDAVVSSGTLHVTAPSGWSVSLPAGCAAWPCAVTVTPETAVLMTLVVAVPAATTPDWYTLEATAVLSGTTMTAHTRMEVTGGTDPATPTPTATALPQPTATATATGIPPRTQGPPAPQASATVLPTATLPATSPTSPAAAPGWNGDAFENNYDAAHATLLIPDERYQMTLEPPEGTAPDVDYVMWVAKPGRCDTLTTAKLAPGVDTNIELLAEDGTVIGGNDDTSATELGSTVTWCAVTTQTVVARIAQNTAVPLRDPAASAYTLVLTTGAAPTATPAPTAAAPTAPVPAAPSIPAAPPLPPVSKNPNLGAPSLPVTVPAQDGAPSETTADPAAADGPTNITIDTQGGADVVCTPLTDTTTEITSTAILAGTEPCEARVNVTDATIPQGLAHVAAADAGLYHGPGAQYVRLAVLPRDYRVLLTGPTRNGWVAVSLTYRTGVPPLIGWVWGPYLEVDSWLQGLKLGAPDVPQPRPDGGDVSALPIPDPSVTTLPQALDEVAFQVAPATTMPLRVQVCRSTTRRCLPQMGLAKVPLEVLDGQGTVLGRGMTDAAGRMEIAIPVNAGTVMVSAPLLGAVTTVTSDGQGQASATIAIEPVAIPPSFR